MKDNKSGKWGVLILLSWKQMKNLPNNTAESKNYITDAACL